jgi:hypothetical protein
MWKGGALQALSALRSENVLRSVVGRGTTNQRAPGGAAYLPGDRWEPARVRDGRRRTRHRFARTQSGSLDGNRRDAATCVAGRGARLFVANRIGWIRKELVTACRHSGSGWATRACTELVRTRCELSRSNEVTSLLQNGARFGPASSSQINRSSAKGSGSVYACVGVSGRVKRAAQDGVGRRTATRIGADDGLLSPT